MPDVERLYEIPDRCKGCPKLLKLMDLAAHRDADANQIGLEALKHIRDPEEVAAKEREAEKLGADDDAKAHRAALAGLREAENILRFANSFTMDILHEDSNNLRLESAQLAANCEGYEPEIGCNSTYQTS